MLAALTPGKSTPARAWSALFGVALVLAALIIGIVVYFTPKPADDPELVAKLAKELKLEVGKADDTPGIAYPPASLVLPLQPSSLTDEQLFQLVAKLADGLLQTLPSDPAALHSAALIHSELKQTAKAETLWQSCLAKHPTAAGPYVAFADLLMKVGRTEQAAELLEQNWSLLAASPAAVQMRAKVLDQLGQPEEAVKLLESSLRAQPNAVDNWLELGQLQNQLQLYPEAENSLRTAVALGMTANETLLFALSTAVSRQNRPEEARKLLEVFQELKKSNADPSGNRFQEAYSTALRKIAARAFMNAAALMKESNKPKEAEQYVMQLLSIDPEHVSGLMTLSALLRQSGRLPDAVLVQKRILELEPDNPLNIVNLASVLGEMGELNDAEALLKEAAQRSRPDLGLFHAELARMYLNLKRYEDARTYARQAAQRQPLQEHFALLAAACKALDDKGGLFEAISGMEQLNRPQSVAPALPPNLNQPASSASPETKP